MIRGKIDKKNIVILLTELAVIFLVVFNILPREASLIVVGIMIFYFIFSPVQDSLWVFIASIPLFIALPITESFDSMASWRILLSVLFLVLFFKSGISINLVKIKQGWKLREKIKHYPGEFLIGIFLLIGFFSLFVASDFVFGFKKLLFLINAFLLFIIIRNVAYKNKEAIFKIINALKVAVGLVLILGFVQLFSTFFIRLYKFWGFWAGQVIPTFYGQAMGNLLSYSNAWFSYYAYQIPTLRMFSVFPDSHSFAFFIILSLPIFLTTIFINSTKNKKKTALLYLFLSLALISIIFSGSRGAWVSAILSLVLVLFVILLFYSPTVRSWTSIFRPKFTKDWTKSIQLIIGSLIIFFLLFPISSGILLISQFREGMDLDKLSIFERARTITDLSELSAKNRLDIWQRTVDSIIKYPVLGVGLGNFPLIINEDISTAKKGASAHNLYLDVAAEMGIFALLVLLAVFWQIFKNAWQIFYTSSDPFFRAWAGFFILALIWILGYSLFDIVLLNDKVLLFFIANLGILYAAKSSLSFNKSS